MLLIYDEFLYIESIRLVQNWLVSDVARANLSDVATENVAVMDCASSFQLTLGLSIFGSVRFWTKINNQTEFFLYSF